ncbi:MAG: hypothetical protein ACRDL1_00735 [Solirubrobacterales bacterium]
MALDLDSYRDRAERFCEEIDREHYLHLSGRKRSFEIEAIYERHAGLFSSDAVEGLRETWLRSGDGEDGRAARHLLHFGFDGCLGQAVKAEATKLAELEASLEVEVESSSIPYRNIAVAQANEPDPERRGAIEAARDELLAEELNPLHLAALERVHELARELGWRSYREAYAELRGVDLEALAGQAREFLRATDAAYAELADPELARAGVPPLGELRRSDLPRFFRAPGLDELFPGEDLVGAFSETVAGLGIDLAAQENVHLDTESRPTKSSRAFCATPHVPEEVYLVISPVGGRDDYEALFHEGGHMEHYAHVDPRISFEGRRLGDNSVTESFAFLFEHLTEDPAWLAARLGVAEPEPVLRHARAVKLVMLRRYAAKIAYELELHGEAPRLAQMPARYVELLGGWTRVRWPGESWLADVDPGFYVACYLRAWALETAWRRSLRERFGERWFASADAGEWLRGLWRGGQRVDAEELLDETLGERLDFGVLAREFSRR